MKLVNNDPSTSLGSTWIDSFSTPPCAVLLVTAAVSLFLNVLYFLVLLRGKINKKKKNFWKTTLCNTALTIMLIPKTGIVFVLFFLIALNHRCLKPLLGTKWFWMCWLLLSEWQRTAAHWLVGRPVGRTGHFCYGHSSRLKCRYSVRATWNNVFQNAAVLLQQCVSENWAYELPPTQILNVTYSVSVLIWFPCQNT